MSGILVVDDSAYTRKMIIDSMATAEFKDIFEAASGEEALMQFKEHKPDLVLLDIILIGMDGMSVLSKIREINPRAKVIVVTAIGQDAYVKEAEALGIEAYITKPFSPKVLVAKIKEILT